MDNTKERTGSFVCQMLPPVNNGQLKPQEYEVCETVERFNREMIAYMNRPEIEVENAIPSATQELGHSYYLKKKRLRDRGMRIHYAKFMHDRSASGALISNYYYINSPKQTVCWERQNMDCDIRYVRNGRIVGRESINKSMKHYVFRAKNAQGLYNCPSCGAVQPLEALLDGCDYCKSQFDINAYRDYVASVCDERSTDYTGTQKRKKNLRDSWWVIILFSLGFSLMIFLPFLLGALFSENHIVVKIILLILFGSAFLFGLFGLLGGLSWVILRKNKAIKKYDAIYDAIRKCNPDFDMDAFASLMDSKIKAAFYAKEKSDISAFVLCQTDAFLRQNQNVISCDVNQIELLNFRTDEKYQYVDVCRQVNLLRDMGNRVVAESKNMYLTLCKKRNYKIKKDVALYRCPNCGASVSLKTGGVCQYCDSKIDYMLYDWAIIGMNYGSKPSRVVRGDGGI